MKKKLLTCLMVLPMLAALGSCGETPSSTPVEPSTPASVESSTPEPVADTFKVMITNDSIDRSLGRVEASKREGIESGEEITFTVKLLKEYADLDYLKINGEKVEVDENLTYKMKVTADVQVNVSFVSPRLLTIASPLAVDEGNTQLTLWNYKESVKFHTKESTWNATIDCSWRFIIIFDAEGYIMYSTAMPVNGYGGPGDTGWYTNTEKYGYPSWGPVNDDGTFPPAPEDLIPCFKILEGFGPWVDGQTKHNNFELVIPEGCYAITGYTDENPVLADFLDAIAPAPVTVGESLWGQYNSSSNPYFTNDLRLKVDEKNNIAAYTAKPAAPAAE